MSQPGSELVTRVRSRLARLGRSATATSATSDSVDEDAPVTSPSVRTTPKQLLRQILHKSNTCQESNDSDTESFSKISASEEESDSEPKGRKQQHTVQRSATLAECLEPPDTDPVIPENLPLETILEKLGHRLKERSDKVHKVWRPSIRS
ncbi:hypothetical protein J6590_066327 [Homalodisca vitripennis]|nr:hypothetical protein J6590_066327 [Homalodisca vitripennis]